MYDLCDRRCSIPVLRLFDFLLFYASVEQIAIASSFTILHSTFDLWIDDGRACFSQLVVSSELTHYKMGHSCAMYVGHAISPKYSDCGDDNVVVAEFPLIPRWRDNLIEKPFG